ncbi:MAG: alpha/beta hydrolase, partial [Myxococcota bacterium]
MAVNQAQPHPQRTETRLTFAGRSFCAALDQTIWGAATLGRRFSKSARARQRGVEVIKNVPYRLGQSIDHRLDVYRTEHGPPTGRPAMLYIHGGGFALCSKDTHWSLALECARLGFVVFNINYRRSSKHPFPAAINDAILALRWVLAQGDRFGADPRRMVIAGESAGGNLTTALAV